MRNSVGLNVFSDNEKFISCVTEYGTFNNSETYYNKCRKEG